MTIIERPVIDHLDVELATVDGVFQLDVSPLDGPDLLAADRGSAYTWTPLLPSATSVTMRRGLARDGVTLKGEVGSLTITLLDAFDPTTNLDVRPNARIRVRDATGHLLFTGLLEDVHVTDSKTGKPVTVLTAVDAVRDVANTPRYGAANPTAEHELIGDRLARLLSSSPVAWRVEDGLPGRTLDYRPEFTTLADAQAEAAQWSAAAARPGDPPHVEISEGPNEDTRTRALTGLTVGRPYVLELDLAVNLSSGTSLPAMIFLAGERHLLHRSPRGRIRIPFTAASTTETLALQFITYPTVVTLYGMVLSEWTPIYACNTVHESDLASHLDIAATTARTAWYVDAAGVLTIAPPRPTPDARAVAHFADDGTGTHGYVGATVAYDTAGLVSSIELQNHARQWDPDVSAWRADDRNLGPWTDPTAFATLGARRAAPETTIADTGLPGAVSPADLARAYLAEHSTAELIVRELRWNAAEDYDLAHKLEVWSLVDVTRRGTTHRMRVITISHEISPERWIITLTLKKETTP